MTSPLVPGHALEPWFEKGDEVSSLSDASFVIGNAPTVHQVQQYCSECVAVTLTNWFGSSAFCSYCLFAKAPH